MKHHEEELAAKRQEAGLPQTTTVEQELQFAEEQTPLKAFYHRLRMLANNEIESVEPFRGPRATRKKVHRFAKSLKLSSASHGEQHARSVWVWKDVKTQVPEAEPTPLRSAVEVTPSQERRLAVESLAPRALVDSTVVGRAMEELSSVATATIATGDPSWYGEEGLLTANWREADCLFLPRCVCMHWWLVVCRFSRNEVHVQVYDSLLAARGPHAAHELRRVVEALSTLYPSAQLKVDIVQGIPQQAAQSNDCAIFAINFARAMLFLPPLGRWQMAQWLFPKDYTCISNHYVASPPKKKLKKEEKVPDEEESS